MSTGVLQRNRSRRQVPPPIDPRLRHRRIEVARDQGRKRLRRVVLVVSLLVLVLGAGLVARSSLLDVDAVRVRGAANTPDRAVRTAAGIPLGSPMVALSASSAAHRVEALPWVERATVRRSWPGTVTISVVERAPAAVVGTGSDAVLVDADGRALGRATGPRRHPLVTGPTIAVGDLLGPARRQGVAIVAALPADLRRQVDHVRAGSTGVTLVLDDGIRARWGDDSQQTAKADALRVLLDEAGRSTIASIDVSVPRATTLRRR